MSPHHTTLSRAEEDVLRASRLPMVEGAGAGRVRGAGVRVAIDHDRTVRDGAGQADDPAQALPLAASVLHHAGRRAAGQGGPDERDRR